jgi:hypothetical protein
MLSRSVLKIVLFATVLMAAVGTASAAAPIDEAATASVGAIHTYLMPDLSLKSVFSVPLAPQIAPAPNFKKFKGSCRCSCATNNCNTDADCGGAVGSCTEFISCCAKTPGAQWSQAPESSRKTELPAFQQSCN